MHVATSCAVLRLGAVLRSFAGTFRPETLTMSCISSLGFSENNLPWWPSTRSPKKLSHVQAMLQPGMPGARRRATRCNFPNFLSERLRSTAGIEVSQSQTFTIGLAFAPVTHL